VPVPEGLRERLLARLHAEHRHVLRRRWLSGLAAAATLLAVAALGVYWYTRPTTFDLEASQSLFLPAGSAEGVDRWFREHHGMQTAAPPDFNYALLASQRAVELQGRLVPELFFVQNNASAQVLILPGDQFNLTALAAQGPVSMGGLTVEVRRHPAGAPYAYLIVYTGGGLNAFLVQEPPQDA
jgi:hypothetical protein